MRSSSNVSERVVFMFLVSASGFYRNGSADGYRVEQLLHVLILQRDAAPCPITFCAVAVNVNQTAEFRVLRRRDLLPLRFDDRVMLRLRDQPVAQPARGIFDVGITHAERQVVSALVVF